MSPYSYAANNPVVYTDPSGLRESSGRECREKYFSQVDSGVPLIARGFTRFAFGGNESLCQNLPGAIIAGSKTVATIAIESIPGKSCYDLYRDGLTLADGFGCLASAAAVGGTAYKIVKVGRTIRAVELIEASEAVGASSSTRGATGVALEVVPDFASEALAFTHYAKHTKGVVLGRKGLAVLKKSGAADLPEFTNFAEYRNAARAFLSSPNGGPGVVTGIRDGNFVKYDPATGFFGVRSSSGVIRTFFRPDDGNQVFLRPVRSKMSTLSDSEFVELFGQLAVASGWREAVSPALVVGQWADFVSQCESGYESSVFEFENDRSVRDLLERVRFHPLLWEARQSQEFWQSVDQIDSKFRQCCRTDVKFSGDGLRWWKTAVPILAFGEFAEDLASAKLETVG